MSVSNAPLKSIENRLLAALPVEEYQRLIPHMERVSLPFQKVLYEPTEPIRHVYFPHQGIVSLVATMLNGSTVEVGLVGNEGMVGIPVFLGGNTTTNRSFVQVAGDGTRMESLRLLAEFNRGGALQKLLLRYMQALHTQVSQTAACNRIHPVEARLARWLLMVSDRMESDQFELTQEFIAQMLGTRRAGVTVAAGTLQQAGMLRYSRGRITILDRKAMDATACECYRTTKDEEDRLLDTTR